MENNKNQNLQLDYVLNDEIRKAEDSVKVLNAYAEKMKNQNEDKVNKKDI